MKPHQQENLDILLKNPEKTKNVIDLILKEVKEESIKIYDEVFKNFKGRYSSQEYKDLKKYAEDLCEIRRGEIEDKYFKTLV